ncbi:MAG TPA: hypothetical protein VFP72_14300 [Kineosporiaceae bacterium]|nr:hypothetical protein [Kineosporiaceae bacterium]
MSDAGTDDRDWGAEVGARTVARRQAAARWRALPAQFLGQLATDPSPAVRRTLAARHDLPADVRALLIRDRDRHVRRVGAGNRTADQATLLAALGDEDFRVRWAAVDNPRCDDVVRRAACDSDDPVVRKKVAEVQGLAREFSDRLLTDPDRDVRAQLSHRTTDLDVLARAVESEDWVLRLGATQNPLLSDAQRRRLARDRNHRVRSTLVLMKAALPEDLELLARDRSSNVRFYVAISKQAEDRVLEILARDSDEVVRGHAEHHLADRQWAARRNRR